ncbi:tyrosine-type recombinase/integrase [Saccharopolyspora phatthalungensis]|uniref:Integrase n=1 Tax=Saccharopolyspora phatthalungensis TaxID=664693 RepID=A0A840Q0W4_9PSEU|nr:tyrosine-type recombinase/integrase [Saccharopolyspora phatthalungensis]MBB5153171.1 integrase [Saccharopolyspora phatthalungensis]
MPIGTYGKIRCYETKSGWRALTKFRDFDGVTRPVERSGKTRAAAERALKKALTERSSTQGGAISADTRFRKVAEEWFSGVEAAVEQGSRSPTTAETYRRVLDGHVLLALGELRLREVTVPRVDAFIGAVRRNVGAPTAKTARSVVSGVLKLAARHGAIDRNPTRDIARIEGGPKKNPRALTLDERVQWLAQLEADEKAVAKDLPDLSRFMLATGVRIGEALAVQWSEVDLDKGVVHVNFTVVRVKGKGLIRKSTKTEYGERTLPLPSWAVEMLKKRHTGGVGLDRPVFPDSLGGLRDPSNTRRDLRNARGTAGFAWVTSHVFRKTAATILDAAGLTARVVADQLGHSRPSMTQDVYLGRKAVGREAAQALEGAFVTESA